MTAVAIGAVTLEGRVGYVPERGRVMAVTEVGPDRVMVRSLEFSDHEPVAVGEVVLLPIVGERVAWEGETGVWLGFAPDVSPTRGQVSAWLLVGAEVVQRRREATVWDARVAVTGRVEGEAVGSVEALSKAVTEAAAQRSAHEVWRERLIEDLHEEARSRGYCSDFDDFMEDHGMPGLVRTRDYNVRARVSLDVWVSVEAESGDDACELVTSEMVSDAAVRQGLSGEDWTVEEAEEA